MESTIMTKTTRFASDHGWERQTFQTKLNSKRKTNVCFVRKTTCLLVVTSLPSNRPYIPAPESLSLRPFGSHVRTPLLDPSGMYSLLLFLTNAKTNI